MNQDKAPKGQWTGPDQSTETATLRRLIPPQLHIHTAATCTDSALVGQRDREARERKKRARVWAKQTRETTHSRLADRSIISRHGLDLDLDLDSVSHARQSQSLRRRGTTQDRHCTFPYQTVTIPLSERQSRRGGKSGPPFFAPSRVPRSCRPPSLSTPVLSARN